MSNNINNNNRQRLGNIINRVFESAGPDGKVRGTPQQIIDKYQALARDAQLAGDWVTAESFLQHSEHYSRMLGEAQAQQNEARQAFERSDGPREDSRSDEGARDDARGDARGDGRGDGRGDRRDGQPRGGDASEQPRGRPDAGQPQAQRSPQAQGSGQPQPSFPSGFATIEPEDDDDGGGLIETPESGGAMTPRAAKAESGGAPNGAHHAAASEAPAASEPPASEPRPAPKRGRPRRKAPTDGEGANAPGE